MTRMQKIWLYASYAPDVESAPLRLMIGAGWCAAWVGVFTIPCLIVMGAR